MSQPYTYNQWIDDNQQYLALQMQLIAKKIADKDGASNRKASMEISSIKKKSSALLKKMNPPPAIETLSKTFNLTPFEQKILLLCAGTELESHLAEVLYENNRNEGGQPTFALALSSFDEAHWSAISPAAPLRYWKMITLGNDAVKSQASMKIDESILHYLTGTGYLNEQLAEWARLIQTSDRPSASLQKLIEKTIDHTTQNEASFPIIILRGRDKKDNLDTGHYLAQLSGMQLLSINATQLPSVTNDITELTRLWNREAFLYHYMLILDCTTIDIHDIAKIHSLQSFVDKISSPLVISTEEWIPEINQKKIIIDVPKPSGAEQLKIWESDLQSLKLLAKGTSEKIVSQFNLSNSIIRMAASELKEKIEEAGVSDKTKIENTLWKICSRYTEPKLEGLAQKMDTIAHWNDLVLPPPQKAILKDLIERVRNRNKVYHQWGFASKGMRGLGISALFSGESGTGKTMAAEVIANELNLDLYKIDLSKVVNKYIGETEKNLKRIFDAAEDGGAILLFDEADALFGKRSNVKDSHDRYSNIEVSYLLQRMEAYRGVAILTTNMKSSMDSAFTRRFSTVLHFPFPDAEQRKEIWLRMFPGAAPVSELDMDKLSRFNLTGGHIKNIALGAAFLAASNGAKVEMEHVINAVKTEYIKMEIPFSSELKMV